MLIVSADGRLLGARRREPLSELPIPGRLIPDDGAFDHPLVQPTIMVLREWARAIKTGERPSPSFDDGVKIQEILEGVQRSSAQGRWVDVNRSRWQVS
jgi:predicted dehydrogenase